MDLITQVHAFLFFIPHTMNEIPAQEEFPEKEHAESIIVPIIKEELQVEKNTVTTGRVKLIKKVVERNTPYSIPLSSESVVVERVAVNKEVDKAPDTRYEGNTMILPVLKEVWVVRKQLVLVEELHITRKTTESILTGEILLREESIDISREDFGNRGTFENKAQDQE